MYEKNTMIKKIIHETGGNGVEIENENGSIIISAKQSITIQCGNSKITLTPEQIVIDSKNTFIN